MSKYNIDTYDYLIKMVIVGDSGVGKSCLLTRFTDGTFTDGFISTIGVDFKIKTVTMNNKTVKIQLWDTAGQERFKTISVSYYRGSQCIMIVFDLTDKSSFDNVRCWFDEIKTYTNTNPACLLVGNKADLTNKRAVSDQEAYALAEALGVSYVETSAKDNTDVETAFNNLISTTIKKLCNSELRNSGVYNKISLTQSNTNKRKCCN